MYGLLKLSVLAFFVITLFQFITLPVEFDANRRAKKELVAMGIIDENELPGVSKTLDAAAWTYVAAFVARCSYLRRPGLFSFR